MKIESKAKGIELLNKAIPYRNLINEMEWYAKKKRAEIVYRKCIKAKRYKWAMEIAYYYGFQDENKNDDTIMALELVLISSLNQSTKREDNANLIGECLRFRESSNEAQTNEYGVPNNPPIKMGENIYGFNFKRMEIIKSTVNKPYYAIGIDTYDKNNLAYCLSRKIGSVVEILLSKTMNDENEFNQEVENIAKYFNAEIIRDI